MKVSQQVLEWQAEARAEGRAEGLVAAILKVLASRFPSGVPADLAASIRGTRDLEKLEQWTVAAVNSATLEEFRRVISNGGT